MRTQDISGLRKPRTKLPVLPVFADRFSPRVFADEPVPERDLHIIFEAARLAPSGRNHQPWLYYWLRKGSEAYKKLAAGLPELNSWAASAPVLIIACYDPTEPDDGENKWATYDLGAATISLILQAQALGYYARQIGSFNADRTAELFPPEKPFKPFVLVALGRIGTDEDYTKADKDILERELQPWSRKECVDAELS